MQMKWHSLSWKDDPETLEGKWVKVSSAPSSLLSVLRDSGKGDSKFTFCKINWGKLLFCWVTFNVAEALVDSQQPSLGEDPKAGIRRQKFPRVWEIIATVAWLWQQSWWSLYIKSPFTLWLKYCFARFVLSIHTYIHRHSGKLFTFVACYRTAVWATSLVKIFMALPTLSRGTF